MAPIYFLLLVVCVTGLFFNLRMLLSCLKDDKRNNTLSRNSKPVAIFQFILHITVLTTNAVETFHKSSQQTDEPCGIIKVLQVSSGWFAIFNFATLILIEYRQKFYGKISPIMVSCTALLGGFFASIDAAVSLSGCFMEQLSLGFQWVLLVINSPYPVGVLLLLVWKKCATREFEASAKKSTAVSSCICSGFDKTTIFHGIIYLGYLVFLLTMIALQVVLINFSPSFLQESYQALAENLTVFCLFTESSVFGIALPLLFKQMIHSLFAETERGNANSTMNSSV